MIDQADGVLPLLQFAEQGFDELEQVIHLLEFAAAVLIHLAVARQDVQFLEQLDGLAGPDFIGARRRLHRLVRRRLLCGCGLFTAHNVCPAISPRLYIERE